MTEQDERAVTHAYIGEDDCKKATCPRKQEFPEGDSPYCLFHALQAWSSEVSAGAR